MMCNHCGEVPVFDNRQMCWLCEVDAQNAAVPEFCQEMAKMEFENDDYPTESTEL